MLKMATKKTKLIDLTLLTNEVNRDITTYFEITNEISRVAQMHPIVNLDYLAQSVSQKFHKDIHWYLEMQEQYKQSIIDNIRGPE